MKKAFISQAMNGIDEETISIQRGKAEDELKNRGYEIIDSYFKKDFEEFNDKDINKPILFMSKGLEKMAQCQVAYFCKGWKNARGCKIEHEIAKQYGLKVLYEE